MTVQLPQLLNDVDESLQQLWLATYEQTFEETSDPVMADLAAWGAIHRDHVFTKLGLKSAQDGAPIVRGWGMMFSDSAQKDLDKQYFNDQSKLLLEFYEGAPLFYDHDGKFVGMHGPIGKRTFVKVFPRGVWAEHELFPNHPFFDKVMMEIARGELFYSSDTLGHLAEAMYKPKDGFLALWPIAGWSLTKKPAEPGLGHVTLARSEEPIKAAKSTELGHKGAYMHKMLKAMKSFAKLPDDASEEEILTTFKRVITGMKSAAGMELDDEEKAFEDEGDEELMPSKSLMAKAFGLKEDSSDDDVIKSMSDFVKAYEAIKAEEGEEDEEGGKSDDFEFDYDAMGKGVKSWKADRTPVRNALPSRVRGQGERRDDDDEGDGFKPRKSRSGRELSEDRPWRRGAPAFHQKRYILHQWAVDSIKHAQGTGIKSFKAQSYEIGPLGGITLRPPVIADEILPMLRANTILDRLDVVMTEVPDNASYIRNKMTNAPSAYWFHANNGPTESEGRFDAIQAVPKGLGARTLIPRYMLEKSPASVEEQIRREIIRSIGLKRDLSAFLGTGSRVADNLAREPIGLDNVPGVNTYPVDGVPGYDDYIEAKGEVEDANVDLTDAAAWVMVGRDIRTIKKLVSTEGTPLYMEDFAMGRREMFVDSDPVFKFNLLPKDLGSGTNESVAYFGEWSFFEVVQSQTLEFFTFNEKYMDNLQIGIMAWTFVDFLIHYPEAFVRLTGVRG